MKLILTEHTDILPGVRKRKGTILTHLPKERQIYLVSENLAEPVDFEGLPEGFPVRKLLAVHGYLAKEQIEAATDEQLLQIDGIGAKTLKDIREFNTNPKNERGKPNG